MVSSTLCPDVHIFGSQNVYSRAEAIADHYWPWAVFCCCSFLLVAPASSMLLPPHRPFLFIASSLFCCCFFLLVTLASSRFFLVNYSSSPLLTRCSSSLLLASSSHLHTHSFLIQKLHIDSLISAILMKALGPTNQLSEKPSYRDADAFENDVVIGGLCCIRKPLSLPPSLLPYWIHHYRGHGITTTFAC